MHTKEKIRHILAELKGHSPFTLLGSFFGILFMLAFRNSGESSQHLLFSIFHPAHVALSALVATSMFKIHSLKKHFLLIIIIGYFGSVGIATLSDIVIPYFSTRILGLDIPSHEQIHNPDADHSEEHLSEKSKIHFAFIDEWYVVNPAAFLGIFIAFYRPGTKFPHAAHILISIWASSSYLLMSIKSNVDTAAAIGIFVTLFISTWVPCCFGDIIFPLLFVKSDLQMTGSCPIHKKHSHEHTQKDNL